MKLEFNDNMVDFADIYSFEDGKRLIESLPKEAFYDFIKIMGVTTTGEQWFEYLVELGAKYEEQPECDPFTEWLDNDN